MGLWSLLNDSVACADPCVFSCPCLCLQDYEHGPHMMQLWAVSGDVNTCILSSMLLYCADCVRRYLAERSLHTLPTVNSSCIKAPFCVSIAAAQQEGQGGRLDHWRDWPGRRYPCLCCGLPAEQAQGLSSQSSGAAGSPQLTAQLRSAISSSLHGGDYLHAGVPALALPPL
jgi:hypothetical protein